jgi:hypothetical protein
MVSGPLGEGLNPKAVGTAGRSGLAALCVIRAVASCVSIARVRTVTWEDLLEAFGPVGVWMRSRRAVVVACASAFLAAAPSAAVAAPAAAGAGGAGGWGHAQRVTGVAQITSVSCASAGNCTAVGNSGPDQGQQAMAVSEVHGRWRKAIELPGTAALNAGESAVVNSVSCASAGNCTAGGLYSDASTAGQAFVASQVNGTWRKAVVFPGIIAANTGFIAAIAAVSCASAGDCSAAGYYTDNLSQTHLFVVSQVRGRWRKPVPVPDIAALNSGPTPGITSVSCGSAGNCAAGGWYIDHQGLGQPFVVSQVNGTWHQAIEVRGPAARNSRGYAEVTSVSCASAGNCSAGGFSNTGGTASTAAAFMVSQVKGTWRAAVRVHGTAALNSGEPEISSVSCATAGNCVAGGFYVDSQSNERLFVVRQVGGTWRGAFELPGLAALQTGQFAGVTSVSCPSAGDCSVGGFYDSHRNRAQAFVVSQARGSWHRLTEVPGTAALNTGGQAQIASVSCTSAHACSGGGWYTGPDGGQHAFVVNRT